MLYLSISDFLSKQEACFFDFLMIFSYQFMDNFPSSQLPKEHKEQTIHKLNGFVRTYNGKFYIILLEIENYITIDLLKKFIIHLHQESF